MNTTSIPTPSRVDKAHDRLETAVAKVEAALNERAPTVAADPDIEQTRAQNVTLREANEKVSQRLDAAIDRLKTVLEE
ncbi:MAG: hypothetical protein ISR44_00095 [Rhodospirillales bacterium]|nr:hypothetical protein [Rhodospirillales bacterium]